MQIQKPLKDLTESEVPHHFSRSVVTFMRNLIGVKKHVYALCVMSKDDRNSETYSIQCSICYERPKYSSLNDDCFIAYQDLSYDGDFDDLFPAEFIFTEYHSSDHDYHLKPIDTKVVVKTISWKFKYYHNPGSFVNVGRYNLTKGSHDEGIRTRIELKLNKFKAPNLMMIFVKSVSSFIPFNFVFI